VTAREGMLQEDDGFFGPGWDLAIALIAVLILILAIEARARQQDWRQKQRAQLDIAAILESQLRLIDKLATHYRTQRRSLGQDTFGIFIRSGSLEPDITIRNDATLQRICFGEHLLFQSDEATLVPGGAAILKDLAAVLEAEVDRLRQIEVEGHADRLTPKAFASNLELAARRAMTVYQALEAYGIDPAHTVMSASSFGAYVPVKRNRADPSYSRSKLIRDNDSPAKQRLNRRIEVVLLYR